MARKNEFETIDGKKYRCDMMKVMDAHQTLISLCATIGEPVVKAIVAGMDDMDGDATSLIMAAISAAMRNLDGPVSVELIQSVYQGVYYVGDGTDKDLGFEMKVGDDKFDDHFHGRLLTMYKVWAWSMKVNYKDFLDAAQALGVGKAKDLGKQVLGTLLTSTSESGA